MSNAKKHPGSASAPTSLCASSTGAASSAGATTMPCASKTPGSTSASSATARRSGESNPDLVQTRADEPPATLAARVADEHYAQRVLDIAARIAETPDQPSVLALLRQGVAALGAECAVFISFVRGESELSTCRLMLDCDPGWSQRYLEAGFLAQDPWLAYAARQTEPVIASTLKLIDDAQRRVVALALDAGFASTVLVPAHSAAGHSRISVLVLGHSQPGYFERGGFAPLRVCARALSAELHDWWLARIRRELVVKSRIRQRDLVLLEHECLGHSSSRIAAELHISRECVNSRFQRIIAKLGVPNRRTAARFAVDCGLIVK